MSNEREMRQEALSLSNFGDGAAERLFKSLVSQMLTAMDESGVYTRGKEYKISMEFSFADEGDKVSVAVAGKLKSPGSIKVTDHAQMGRDGELLQIVDRPKQTNLFRDQVRDEIQKLKDLANGEVEATHSSSSPQRQPVEKVFINKDGGRKQAAAATEEE